MAQLNKVAKITLIFWVMKIVATTKGETLGDFLSMSFNLGYVVGKIYPCNLLDGVNEGEVTDGISLPAIIILFY